MRRVPPPPPSGDRQMHVRLTPLAVGALLGLGFASFAVGRGGGVRGGAGAAAVFLFHRG